MTIASGRSATAGRQRGYLEARRRGVEWLLGHLADDGALGDPTQGYHFYRAPWTFAACGRTDAAVAVCGWIRRHMLTPAGTIEGPYRVFQDAYAYRNATLIVGAHMALQYDLSYGLMSELLAWQDARSGGTSNDRLPDGSMSDAMDLPYSCGPGFACLQTGHLGGARRVYTYLRNLYDAQRDLPDRFYYAWSRSRDAAIREYPEESRFWYVVENQLDAPQRWTIGGIAAGFLCRLYLAEPKEEYLALARRYQAFSMAATEAQFSYAQVCKSGWGSSLLYQIAGEESFRDWTYRMGDWFAREQRPEGHWEWPRYRTLGQKIELTLEFVMHLDTLIGGLASRP